MGNNKSDDEVVKKIIGGAFIAGALYKGSKEFLKKKSTVPFSKNAEECEDDFPVTNLINKYGNTSKNISNGGFISRQGEYLYYACYGSLYKSKLDNTCIEEIDSDIHPHNINVVGEWIYYSSSSGIFKISESGKVKIKLSDMTAKYIMVIDDKIFYTDETNLLHSMTIDGEIIKLPQEDYAFNLNIVNDKMYSYITHKDYEPYSKGYTVSSVIYERDFNFKLITTTDLGNFNIISSKTPIIISDNYIYYIYNSDLFRAEINSDNNVQKLQESVENNFTVDNGFIYFGKFHKDENKKTDSLLKSLKQWALDELHVCDGLYKMKIDGTNLAKISSDNWCYKNKICIIGNYIYSNDSLSNKTLKRVNINHIEN